MALSNIVTVSLQVNGMKHGIITALHDYEGKIQEEIRRQVELVCQPESLQAVFEREVQTIIKNAVRDQLKYFYTYGPGAKAIKQAVYESLGKETRENTNEPLNLDDNPPKEAR